MQDFIDKILFVGAEQFRAVILDWGSYLFWGYGLFYLLTLSAFYIVAVEETLE